MISGGASTSIVTVTVLWPPLFCAVTTYGAAADAADGVPEMVPSVVLKLSPAGSAGLIDHPTTAPPAEVGAIVVAATVALKVTCVAPYEILDGGLLLTVMAILAETVAPAESVALIV